MISRKGEGGQIVVLTALSMTIMFGCLALAIDVGLLFNMKRKLQNAVDAAATSGAIDYMFNYSHSSATAAATSALQANGFSVTPTVNFYPNIISAYHNNSDNYVQVIASITDPTFFLGAFQGMMSNTRSTQQSVTIQAMAVAGLPGQGNACVIVLDPTASGAMTLQGSFDVSADDCGVVVDSNNGAALQFTGGGGSLTAGYVAVVGGDSGQTSDSTPNPVTGATPVNNPFPNMTGPDPTNSNDCSSTIGNLNTSSSYSGGQTINMVNGVACFTNSSGVTLNNFDCTHPLPTGILVFQYGVTLSGTVDTTGAPTSVSSSSVCPVSGSTPYGTTFDMYGGAFTVATGSTLSIYAPNYSTNEPSNPTTGWYVPSGMAVLQPSTNNSTLDVQFGSSYGNFDGIIYAPSAEIYMHDSGGDHNGGVTLTTDLIVDKVYDQTATLTINSYTKHYGNLSPLTAVALVE